MGSVFYILGMDVRNHVENQTVHLSQTQYINNVYNNFPNHGVYCYGRPMVSKAQLSKSQCSTEGSAEASQMKNMPCRELIGLLLWWPIVQDQMFYSQSIR
jgi:hypothetical protein